LSTLEMECAEQGLDWEDVLEQQARERSRRQKLGLPEPGATASTAPPPEPDDDEAPAGQNSQEPADA